MSKRYLLAVTDEDAQHLEQWLGGRLVIGPGGDIWAGVTVTALDAITDKEARPICKRLASGGPMYHAGGPEQQAGRGKR